MALHPLGDATAIDLTIHDDRPGPTIPLGFSSPEYRLGAASVPMLHASGSRDAQRRLHVSLVNLDPHRPLALRLSRGAQNLSGRVLTAPNITEHNTFESPERVRPAPYEGASSRGDELWLRVPEKSVVVLELS